MRRLALIVPASVLTSFLSSLLQPLPVTIGAGSTPPAPPLVAVLGTGPAAEVPATTVAARLAEEEVVDLSEVVVVGELDLRDIHTVRPPFRCIGCVFTGSIVARDVNFERILDLSGSRIDGSLDVRGAVFDGGFLLRGSEDHPAQVSGTATLAQATFGDGSGFDRSTFVGAADFTGSSFVGDSSFADALFQADALFDDVSFGGNTLFSSLALAPPGSSGPPVACQPPVMGAFVGAASFNRATFHSRADFRQRCFVGAANFQSATFGKRVDFALSIFHGEASFDGATFESDSAFLASIFETGASFLRVAATGSLVFDDSVFGRDVQFFRVAVTGALSFEDAAFHGEVDLRRASVGDLIMDLADVEKVVGRARERQDVLALIESSAIRRGELALANNARFELLALQNTRLGWFSRTADWFFYRLLAGYLVRPLYPLLAFLVVLGIGALIRVAIWLRQERKRHVGRLLGATRLVSALFARLGDTIQVAFRRKPQIVLEDTEQIRPYLEAGVKWVEFIAFKVLIALFLLALASSNSTLKQLIDSVRG